MSLGYQNCISDRSIATNNLLSERLLAFRNSLENALKALKADVGTSWGIKSLLFAFSFPFSVSQLALRVSQDTDVVLRYEVVGTSWRFAGRGRSPQSDLYLLLLWLEKYLAGVLTGWAANTIAARRRENNSSSCSGVSRITNWPSGRGSLDCDGNGVDVGSPTFGADALLLRVVIGCDDLPLIARPSDSKLIESC